MIAVSVDWSAVGYIAVGWLTVPVILGALLLVLAVRDRRDAKDRARALAALVAEQEAEDARAAEAVADLLECEAIMRATSGRRHPSQQDPS